MSVNRSIILALGLVITVSQAPALTIVRNFTGGSAPGNAVGAGTLQSVFNAAADCWEHAILDSHTVTLSYSWGGQSGSTLAAHSLGTQGGSPNRETAGSIVFDNDGSSVYYMDDTPHNHSEFSTYTATDANLGGGMINIGRVFTGASGLAAGRSDLFSVALHEIGHSLGMSAANLSFAAEIALNGAPTRIIVDGPVPHAGSVLPTVSGAHLNLSSSLMFPSISSGVRRIIAASDILANAEISRFVDLNLDPCPVPEPSTLALVGLGAICLLRRKRIRKTR